MKPSAIGHRPSAIGMTCATSMSLSPVLSLAARCPLALVVAGSFLASAALPLTGCTGSDYAPSLTTETEASLAYSNTVAPRYSTAPYETPPYFHWWTTSEGSTELRIGADVEPRESLRHVLTGATGIRYYMGSSRDGVGVARLRNYQDDLVTEDGADPYDISGYDGFAPFIIKPNLILDLDLKAPEHADILAAVWDSVEILNDALPPEFQIAVFTPRPGYVHGPGDIFLHLESPDSAAWGCDDAAAVACTVNLINQVLNYTRSSEVWLPDDFDASNYTYMRSVILHEFLHALGIWGHVDSIEFPDSVMGTAGETIPNLGYIISQIDREVLQIMYMSQESDLYNDWGEWSDLSHHLMGRTADDAMSFGVALFNGLPQPWVRGAVPPTGLADNSRLSGTATWSGKLMAYSGPSPLFGDASLQVGLATLGNPGAEQDLRFRDIFYLNRYGSDSDDRWFHTRDIDYKVKLTGNSFYNVSDEGYEEGLVAGAFFGRSHEHMGGTVKRTDLVGSFGGSR